MPSDQLMPLETRGFASIQDINLLVEHWHQTQLGKLVQDEAMRPFVEDMQKQLERKVSGVRDKLGIALSDLQDVAGGEVGMGMIEVQDSRAAVAITVDTSGNHRQLETLLAKVDKELTKRNATKNTVDQNGTTITTYAIPAQREDGKDRQMAYFVKDNILCVSDSLQQTKAMLGRFETKGGGLSEVIGYQQTMQRCQKEADTLVPDLRWYVDPFGYARCVRSLEKADAKHPGKDYVKILEEQGFDAIQAAGGYVNLFVGGSYELLHRTAVYAPPIPGEPDKYRLAMRMMKFPNQQPKDTDAWLPRRLASYRTVSCDMDNAFQFFGSLFDAIAGYEDAFDGVLEGLERDPYGPQVDVQKDFVDQLGERVTFITDYELPITTKSERFLIVVELKNAKKITKTVEKFMKSDPNAVQTEFEGKTIWEIHEPEADIPEIDITVNDLDLLTTPEEPQESEPLGGGLQGSALSSSAVCVTADRLFIASHAEFLRKVLSKSEPQDQLQNAGDFREVDGAMARLLPGPVSASFFVRTDEAYRPVYDLLRQGKMPESETLLGRLLNRLLTPPENEDEGLLREQKIDGRQLPDFEMVRRYFGPSGTLVRSDDDGWFVVGATLTKMAPQARASSSQLSSDVKTLR
jgi:hypothetical protein